MFVRFYRKSSKYDLELNADLKEIIIGLMLGDLFAEKRNPNSNTRLQFKQSSKNKKYIFLCITKLGFEPKPTAHEAVMLADYTISYLFTYFFFLY